MADPDEFHKRITMSLASATFIWNNLDAPPTTSGRNASNRYYTSNICLDSQYRMKFLPIAFMYQWIPIFVADSHSIFLSTTSTLVRLFAEVTFSHTT
jgi:hypothetical protein